MGHAYYDVVIPELRKSNGWALGDYIQALERIRLAEALVRCATSPAHAFVNNATPERLEEAFAQIGRQLRPLRRVW